MTFIDKKKITEIIQVPKIYEAFTNQFMSIISFFCIIKLPDTKRKQIGEE